MTANECNGTIYNKAKGRKLYVSSVQRKGSHFSVFVLSRGTNKYLIKMPKSFYLYIYVNVGRDSIPVRRPDSQSREPGFKSHCGRFESLASLITPRCHSSLSCINEYLAIQTVVDT